MYHFTASKYVPFDQQVVPPALAVGCQTWTHSHPALQGLRPAGGAAGAGTAGVVDVMVSVPCLLHCAETVRLVAEGEPYYNHGLAEQGKATREVAKISYQFRTSCLVQS